MNRLLDFRERSRLYRAVYAKPTIIVLAVLCIFVAHAAWRMYGKSLDAEAKREKSREELEKLQQRETELSQDILRLSTERGMEEEIRERFMVAKEGEKVMIITEPQKETPYTIVVPEKDRSMFEKMMSAVGLLGE